MSKFYSTTEKLNYVSRIRKGYMNQFEVGQWYKRTTLHAEHGGQRQGGISTPAGKPFLMLFTGRGGKHGYDDGWHDGVFRYYGEGQVGDMEFTGGNKAIRDSA